MSDPPASPPTSHAHPAPPVKASSLLVVYTGDGKGKSTAAFGAVLRAVGGGWDVAVVQFLKSGAWKVGEEVAARRLGVTWEAIGEGFTWESEDLSEDQARAQTAWARAADLIAAGAHRLVVLDEITYALTWGWLDVDAVLGALRDRPPHVSVVATGRDAPQALVDAADTVTEMRKVKHAYDRGVLALKGLDF